MKYIVIGNGTHATLVRNYVEESGKKIEAFVVEQEYVNGSEYNGCPVLSIEEMVKKYPINTCKLFMGIGYKNMGDIRRKLFEKMKEIGYSFDNYIHPTCILPDDIEIGEGNIFLESVIVEKRCKIGDANLFYGGTMVGHDSELGSYITMAGKSSCMGEVSIKNNCFLGGSSAVRNKVTLNDHVLLGAMALAYKDVPAYAVVKAPKSEIDTSVSSLEYMR